MKKKLMVANWKMNKAYKDLDYFVSTLGELGFLKQQEYQDIVIAPAFPFLDKMKFLLEGSSVVLAAQNVHTEGKGAFTGEVSCPMLKDLNIQYVIVGHSERRQYFKESDEEVARKAKACVDHELTAIVCVGESLDERNSNHTFSVIEKQTHAILDYLPEANRLVIAYEPVWAIGTGISASETQAQEVHAFIRSILEKKYGAQQSEKVHIIYGGSLNASNAEALLKQEDIDGGLIGGASLEAKTFSEILKCV